jgi:hypothetical protein
VPDDARAAFDEIYRRGWTDGLPVIPPRQEYIQEMIECSGLQPDEIIAELAPEGAPATVEKIAINAVMAGCRNEYLPVLIAAVKAMAQPQFNLLWVQATTNAVAPFVVINGPIRHKLDLNCGRGALGPGRRANATIGRAIRLIMLNIGGGQPGEVDKSELGQPGKFTFCLGEAEEESPWDPLHVELGYRREESTISLIGVQGSQAFRTPFLQPESILMMVAKTMAASWAGCYNNGTGQPVVIFSPGYANLFHNAGWSKSRVKQWLFEETKVPAALMPQEPTLSRHRRPRILQGDDRLWICEKPEDITIVVAGSSDPYHVTHLPNAGSTEMATQLIAVGG